MVEIRQITVINNSNNSNHDNNTANNDNPGPRVSRVLSVAPRSHACQDPTRCWSRRVSRHIRRRYSSSQAAGFDASCRISGAGRLSVAGRLGSEVRPVASAPGGGNREAPRPRFVAAVQPMPTQAHACDSQVHVSAGRSLSKATSYTRTKSHSQDPTHSETTSRGRDCKGQWQLH